MKIMDHKRPDHIPGYEHPETSIPIQQGPIYKTFTEGLTPKKNEKFDNTKNTSQYPTISDTMSKCSKCNTISCSCFRS